VVVLNDDNEDANCGFDDRNCGDCTGGGGGAYGETSRHGALSPASTPCV
jgi:hypothetical protein